MIFGWDIQDKAYTSPLEFAGKDCQYSDLIAKVDLGSFRRIPWENNIPFFFVNLYHPTTNKPLYCCPRNVLKGAVDSFAELGLVPYCGVEFEFFCFKGKKQTRIVKSELYRLIKYIYTYPIQTPFKKKSLETTESLHSKDYSQLAPLTLGMCGYSVLRPLQNQEFYYNAFDWLKDFQVDVESWHTETGPGVFEAALLYQTASEMGDRATLFKTSMKQIGLKHKVMPSFMAKPYGDQPGCSGHMHFSLKNEKGENAFAVGEYSKNVPNLTVTAVWFLAGVLKGLPSILAILAPTVNRYLRNRNRMKNQKDEMVNLNFCCTIVTKDW